MSHKRQKSDDNLSRKSRSGSVDEKKIIGIIEDEDFAVAIGKKPSSESGSELERKPSLIHLVETDKDNVKMIVTNKNESHKLSKRDSRKIEKLLKLLREELAEKKSNKLHLFDGLEKMYRKIMRKSRRYSEVSEDGSLEASLGLKSTLNVDKSADIESKRKENSGFDLGEELTVDEESSINVKKNRNEKQWSDKPTSNAIRIKIAPQVHSANKDDGVMPQSLINIEQVVDQNSPLTLKVNNQPINSTKKFEKLINFPETIDITINSPDSRAEIRLPSFQTPESEPTTSPQTKLAESESTSSDLRSLFEAYRTDTSNFSNAFKPCSQSSSRQASRTTSPLTHATTASTTPEILSPALTSTESSRVSSLSEAPLVSEDQSKEPSLGVQQAHERKDDLKLQDVGQRSDKPENKISREDSLKSLKEAISDSRKESSLKNQEIGQLPSEKESELPPSPSDLEDQSQPLKEDARTSSADKLLSDQPDTASQDAVQKIWPTNDLQDGAETSSLKSGQAPIERQATSSEPDCAKEKSISNISEPFTSQPNDSQKTSSQDKLKDESLKHAGEREKTSKSKSPIVEFGAKEDDLVGSNSEQPSAYTQDSNEATIKDEEKKGKCPRSSSKSGEDKAQKDVSLKDQKGESVQEERPEELSTADAEPSTADKVRSLSAMSKHDSLRSESLIGKSDEGRASSNKEKLSPIQGRSLPIDENRPDDSSMKDELAQDEQPEESAVSGRSLPPDKQKTPMNDDESTHPADGDQSKFIGGPLSFDEIKTSEEEKSRVNSAKDDLSDRQKTPFKETSQPSEKDPEQSQGFPSIDDLVYSGAKPKSIFDERSSLKKQSSEKLDEAEKLTKDRSERGAIDKPASDSDLKSQTDLTSKDGLTDAERISKKSSSIRSKLDSLKAKSLAKDKPAQDDKIGKSKKTKDDERKKHAKEKSPDALSKSAPSSRRGSIKREPSVKSKKDKISPRRQSLFQRLLSPIRSLGSRRSLKSMASTKDSKAKSDDIEKQDERKLAQDELDKSKITPNRRGSMKKPWSRKSTPDKQKPLEDKLLAKDTAVTKSTPADDLKETSGTKSTPADDLKETSGTKSTPADDLKDTAVTKSTPADDLRETSGTKSTPVSSSKNKSLSSHDRDKSRPDKLTRDESVRQSSSKDEIKPSADSLFQNQPKDELNASKLESSLPADESRLDSLREHEPEVQDASLKDNSTEGQSKLEDSKSGQRPVGSGSIEVAKDKTHTPGPGDERGQDLANQSSTKPIKEYQPALPGDDRSENKIQDDKLMAEPDVEKIQSSKNEETLTDSPIDLSKQDSQHSSRDKPKSAHSTSTAREDRSEPGLKSSSDDGLLPPEIRSEKEDSQKNPFANRSDSQTSVQKEPIGEDQPRTSRDNLKDGLESEDKLEPNETIDATNEIIDQDNQPGTSLDKSFKDAQKIFDKEPSIANKPTELDQTESRKSLPGSIKEDSKLEDQPDQSTSQDETAPQVTDQLADETDQEQKSPTTDDEARSKHEERKKSLIKRQEPEDGGEQPDNNVERLVKDKEKAAPLGKSLSDQHQNKQKAPDATSLKDKDELAQDEKPEETAVLGRSLSSEKQKIPMKDDESTEPVDQSTKDETKASSIREPMFTDNDSRPDDQEKNLNSSDTGLLKDEEVDQKQAESDAGQLSEDKLKSEEAPKSDVENFFDDKFEDASSKSKHDSLEGKSSVRESDERQSSSEKLPESSNDKKIEKINDKPTDDQKESPSKGDEERQPAEKRSGLFTPDNLQDRSQSLKDKTQTEPDTSQSQDAGEKSDKKTSPSFECKKDSLTGKLSPEDASSDARQRSPPKDLETGQQNEKENNPPTDSQDRRQPSKDDTRFKQNANEPESTDHSQMNDEETSAQMPDESRTKEADLSNRPTDQDDKESADEQEPDTLKSELDKTGSPSERRTEPGKKPVESSEPDKGEFASRDKDYLPAENQSQDKPRTVELPKDETANLSEDEKSSQTKRRSERSKSELRDVEQQSQGEHKNDPLKDPEKVEQPTFSDSQCEPTNEAQKDLTDESEQIEERETLPGEPEESSIPVTHQSAENKLKSPTKNEEAAKSQVADDKLLSPSTESKHDSSKDELFVTPTDQSSSVADSSEAEKLAQSEKPEEEEKSDAEHLVEDKLTSSPKSKHDSLKGESPVNKSQHDSKDELPIALADDQGELTNAAEERFKELEPSKDSDQLKDKSTKSEPDAVALKGKENGLAQGQKPEEEEKSDAEHLVEDKLTSSPKSKHDSLKGESPVNKSQHDSKDELPIALADDQGELTNAAEERFKELEPSKDSDQLKDKSTKSEPDAVALKDKENGLAQGQKPEEEEKSDAEQLVEDKLTSPPKSKRDSLKGESLIGKSDEGRASSNKEKLSPIQGRSLPINENRPDDSSMKDELAQDEQPKESAESPASTHPDDTTTDLKDNELVLGKKSKESTKSDSVQSFEDGQKIPFTESEQKQSKDEQKGEESALPVAKDSEKSIKEKASPRLEDQTRQDAASKDGSVPSESEPGDSMKDEKRDKGSESLFKDKSTEKDEALPLTSRVLPADESRPDEENQQIEASKNLDQTVRPQSCSAKEKSPKSTARVGKSQPAISDELKDKQDQPESTVEDLKDPSSAPCDELSPVRRSAPSDKPSEDNGQKEADLLKDEERELAQREKPDGSGKQISPPTESRYDSLRGESLVEKPDKSRLLSDKLEESLKDKSLSMHKSSLAEEKRPEALRNEEVEPAKSEYPEESAIGAELSDEKLKSPSTDEEQSRVESHDVSDVEKASPFRDQEISRPGKNDEPSTASDLKDQSQPLKKDVKSSPADETPPDQTDTKPQMGEQETGKALEADKQSSLSASTNEQPSKGQLEKDENMSPVKDDEQVESDSDLPDQLTGEQADAAIKGRLQDAEKLAEVSSVKDDTKSSTRSPTMSGQFAAYDPLKEESTQQDAEQCSDKSETWPVGKEGTLKSSKDAMPDEQAKEKSQGVSNAEEKSPFNDQSQPLEEKSQGVLDDKEKIQSIDQEISPIGEKEREQLSLGNLQDQSQPFEEDVKKSPIESLSNQPDATPSAEQKSQSTSDVQDKIKHSGEDTKMKPVDRLPSDQKGEKPMKDRLDDLAPKDIIQSLNADQSSERSKTQSVKSLSESKNTSLTMSGQFVEFDPSKDSSWKGKSPTEKSTQDELVSLNKNSDQSGKSEIDKAENDVTKPDANQLNQEKAKEGDISPFDEIAEQPSELQDQRKQLKEAEKTPLIGKSLSGENIGEMDKQKDQPDYLDVTSPQLSDEPIGRVENPQSNELVDKSQISKIEDDIEDNVTEENGMKDKSPVEESSPGTILDRKEKPSLDDKTSEKEMDKFLDSTLRDSLEDIDKQKSLIKKTNSPVSGPPFKKEDLKVMKELGEKLSAPEPSNKLIEPEKKTSRASSSSSDSRPYLTFNEPDEQHKSKTSSADLPQSSEVFSDVMSPQAFQESKSEEQVNSDKQAANEKMADEKPKISLTASHSIEVPGLIEKSDQDSLALTNLPEIVYDTNLNLESKEDISSLQSQWLTDVIPNEDKPFEVSEKSDKLRTKSPEEGYSKDEVNKLYEDITKAIDKTEPHNAPFLQEEADKDKRASLNRSLRSERRSDAESIKSKSPAKSHQLIDTNLKDIVESLNNSLQLIEKRMDSLKSNKSNTKRPSIGSQKSTQSRKSNKPESAARALVVPEALNTTIISDLSSEKAARPISPSIEKNTKKMKKCDTCHGLGFLTLKDQNKYDS